MAKLTYADLEKQGLELTKDEAQKLQSPITHIAKFGADGANDVFDYDKTAGATGNLGGLSSVKSTAGFDPNPKKTETAKQKKDREAREAVELKRLEDLKEAGLEERPVTQEDLDDDPTLVEKGLKVGDVYQFAIEAE